MEQAEFRAAILKTKPKPKKEKPPPPPPRVITRNEYMNNCIFWINEFEARRANRERLIIAAKSLAAYCNQIISEHEKK